MTSRACSLAALTPSHPGTFADFMLSIADFSGFYALLVEDGIEVHLVIVFNAHIFHLCDGVSCILLTVCHGHGDYGIWQDKSDCHIRFLSWQ